MELDSVDAAILGLQI